MHLCTPWRAEARSYQRELRIADNVRKVKNCNISIANWHSVKCIGKQVNTANLVELVPLTTCVIPYEIR
jgi:hypothetical protein